MGLQTPTSGRKPVGKAQGVAGCRDPIRKDSRILSFRHPHRRYSRLYQGLTGPSTTVVFLDERHKLPLGEFFESVTSGEYGRGKSAAALI